MHFLLRSLSFIILTFGLACTQSKDARTGDPAPPETAQETEDKQTIYKKEKQGLPILQGYTNANSAQFSVLHKKGVKLNYFIRSFETLSNFKSKPIEIKKTKMPHSSYVVSRLTVRNLRPLVNYTLEIWTENKFQLLDSREFSTMNFGTSKVKILMAGCFKLNKTYQQTKMWNEALSHSPDLIILNGDNVYASEITGLFTSVNSDSIWADYVNWRRHMSFYFRPRLTPTLAIWDDGDYGSKDGDRSFPFKQVSKVIFEAFFPQEPDGVSLIEGPGLSKMLRAFGLDIFLLDARSFRSPKGETAQTQWGLQQEQWLLTRLNKSLNPSFLIQGDQFFGGHHPFESYEGQRPLSFRNLMEEIKKVPKPVAFFSGDRHLTELMVLKQPEWPYPSFEFTTSAMHANTYEGSNSKYPNPRQLYGVDGTQNYGILEVNTDGPNAQVHISAWGINNLKLYEQVMQLKR